VRHDVVQNPVGVAGVVDREDVRVVERRGDGDLAQEPLGPEDRGQFGPQHLHRDLAAVLQVIGEIDRGHAAAAQLALDGVAGAQSGGQACQVIGCMAGQQCTLLPTLPFAGRSSLW
jgi:hypothetical protein